MTDIGDALTGKPLLMDIATLSKNLCLSESTIEDRVKKNNSRNRYGSTASAFGSLQRFTSTPQSRKMEMLSSGRRFVRRHSGHSGVMTDTFASVIRAYTNSPNFNRLADSTKQIYRVYLTKAEVILGDLPLGVIRPFLIQQCLDALADRPGAQSNMRTVL